MSRLLNTISQFFSDVKRDFEVSSSQDAELYNLGAFLEVDQYICQSFAASDNSSTPLQTHGQILDSLKGLKAELGNIERIRDVSMRMESLAEQSVERDKPMPLTDVDFSESQLDAQKVLEKTTRGYLQILYRALAAQLSCCDANHLGRLKLTGFVDQVDLERRIFFDIYLSSRDDWEPSSWVESRCTIGSARPQFQGEEPGCHIIRRSEESNENLNLLIEETEVNGVARDQCHRIPTMSSPTRSLGELLDWGCFRSTLNLDDNDYFLPLDRAELCFNLALSLLHLSHNEWRQVRWGVDTIFFLRDPGSRKLVEKTRPYLSWRLKNDFTKPGADAEQLLCDPHLLKFAQLLVEIHSGERVDSSGPLSPISLRSKISALVKSRRAFLCNQEKFKEALKACIGAAGKEAGQETSSPDTMQIFIYQNIVLNLEAYLHAGTEPLEHTPVSTTHPVQGSTIAVDKEKKGLFDAVECRTPGSYSAAQEAEGFLARMENFTRTHIIPLSQNRLLFQLPALPEHRSRKIKIAVIDSGITRNDPRIRGARRSGKIQTCRNFFTPDPDKFEDECGHGMLVTLLLMQIAPEAEIYVAKVSDGRYIDKDKLHCIAAAISWAVQKWDVDIITMSLVLPEADDIIERALNQALDPSYNYATRKMIFAAAGNKGGNAGLAWPALRPGVIAIHATDGLGSAANFNPNATKAKKNFATLGCDIKMLQKPSGRTEEEKNVYVSGTSFATPIAAGIAANILEFARHRLNLTEDQKRRLYSGHCMRKIFKKMMGARGDYNYVQPWGLWEQARLDGKDICRVLTEIIEDS